MKKVYSFLCLLLIVTSGFGQNRHTEKADELYESYQYVDAIEEYLKLVKSKKANAYVFKQLADSYYNLFNKEKASEWYKRAIKKKQDAETHYRYAQVLRSQGKYEDANKQMDVFAKKKPNDQRAKAHIENPNYIPKLADITKLFNVEQTNINDEKQSDFGAVLSNDNTLYFVSTRNSSQKEDRASNQPYLDIYKSERHQNGTLSEPEEVSELNTFYHDGPLTVSADGNTMYFSRDGHSEGSYKKLKNSKVKLAQQGIYKATMLNGKWCNIKALPINSTEYTVTHPSISQDGKTLYYASNMPGGLGDTDIWKISVNGNTYGEPINLGSNVNTSGKEGFPYISEGSTLYFTSSGQQGFGGYDVFKCNLNSNEAAVNLGNAVNTKSDDFAFSINDAKQIGYFSSNRSGADNIYLAVPICQFKAFVSVKDAQTNAIISKANVSILDAQNNPIALEVTGKSGETDFNIFCESTYTITTSKEGYISESYKIEETNGKDVYINAVLKPINELITDTEVKLNNIYFEFNKSNITQQGALELDKLVSILKDYKEMKILVRSHTDSKGSSAYNLKLSEKRAQATVQYLISKEINKERLRAEGIGSSEPKIDCKSNCTDEEDSQNRRSEFLIVKGDYSLFLEKK